MIGNDRTQLQLDTAKDESKKEEVAFLVWVRLSRGSRRTCDTYKTNRSQPFSKYYYSVVYHWCVLLDSRYGSKYGSDYRILQYGSG